MKIFIYYFDGEWHYSKDGQLKGGYRSKEEAEAAAMEGSER